MLMIVYCPKCREMMEEHGEMVSILYDQICEHYVLTGSCLQLCTEIHKPLLSAIRFLEKKRYIVSTESELCFIQAKPLGVKFSTKFNEDNDIDSVCFVCFHTESHQEWCHKCDEAQKGF